MQEEAELSSLNNEFSDF